MSVKDCIDKVSKAMSQSRLRKSDVKQILEELDAEAKRLAADGQGDYVDNVRDIAMRFNKFVQRQAREEKRRSLLQLRSRQQMKAKINNFVSQGLTPRQAVMASMVGLRSKGVEGSMNSTAAKQMSRSNRNMTNFIKHLESEDLLTIFRSKDETIQLQILEAIEQMNTKGASKPGGQVGRIAELYTNHMKLAREELRLAGVDTRDIDGFSISQSHNPELMSMAGEVEWTASIRDKLDYERIFGTSKYNAEDIDNFLQSTYAALVSGTRLTPDLAMDNAIAAPKPRNMAERLAGSRVIHFKTTADFFEYNKQFGRGSSQESMVWSLRSAGFYSALMEDFGPNPRSNFDLMMQQIKKDLRKEGDFSNIKDLDRDGFFQKMSGSDLEALFNNIDGTAFIAKNPKSARVASNIRSWVSMSKLGQATISAISDNPIMAEVLSRNGINHAEGYVRAFVSSAKRIPKHQRKHFASMVDTYQEVTTGSIANRMGLFDERPGKMQEAMRIFYKANGLEWWTNAHKEGVAAALSHNLYRHVGLSYDELGNKLGGQLREFGITRTEWDALRSVAPENIDGRMYITSDSVGKIQSLDDAARRTLQDKLDSYFIETVNNAVVTPGARERAVQNWGLQAGTPLGEFVRTVMLFKSFPITFSIKVLAPSIRNAKNGDVGHLAALIIGMTSFGAVAMGAKDLLKGRDPLSKIRATEGDPHKAFKYFTAIALQGGGLGIYGDFLFGQYNRVGNSLTQTVAGPVYGGMVSDIGRIWSDMQDTATGKKDIGKLGASALNAAKGYLPGGNLPYLAPALNYFLIYQLQEAMNPGYLSRMERRMEREQGIEFLQEPIDLRPSSVVN